MTTIKTLIDRWKRVSIPYLINYGNVYSTNIVDEVNLAPTNWRIPTVSGGAGGPASDFSVLSSYVIANSVSGFDGAIKSTVTSGTDPDPYWDSPNSGAENFEDFDLLSGGYRAHNGTYSLEHKFGTILSDIHQYPGAVKDWGWINGINTSSSLGIFTTVTSTNHAGGSIRFIMIDPSGWNPGDTVSDYEGNVYQTIQVGTQVWTAENWKSNYYTDGSLIPLVQDDVAWSNAIGGARSYKVV